MTTPNQPAGGNPPNPPASGGRGTTTWGREILSTILGHPAGHALTRALEVLWDKAMEHGTAKWINYRLTGQMPLEDENLVLLAKVELEKTEPNIVRENGNKLDKLEAWQQDYYRLTICGHADPQKPKDEDDRRRVENIKGIMRLHALMTAAEWAQEIKNMNYNQDKAEGILTQIKDAAAKFGEFIAIPPLAAYNQWKATVAAINSSQFAQQHVDTAKKAADDAEAQLEAYLKKTGRK